MRLLLDTQAWLWFVLGDNRLSQAAQLLLADAQNLRLLSVASCWEIAIKISIGKYRLNAPFLQFVDRGTSGAGVGLLPVEPRHLERLTSMPFHHRDPFDRLIVAQGLVDGMKVISPDGVFDQYGVDRVW